MNCENAREMLKPLIQGEISGEEARAVRQHLASCPECSARLDPSEWIEVLPAMDGTIEPSPGFAAGLRSKLDSRRRPWWKKAAGFWPGRLAAAGALAAVLLAGVLLIRHPGSRLPHPAGPMAGKPAESLELPEDMAVLSNLDLLENFETIEALPRLMKDAH